MKVSVFNFFGCRVEDKVEAQASSELSIGIIQSHTCKNFGAICFRCKFGLNHIMSLRGEMKFDVFIFSNSSA